MWSKKHGLSDDVSLFCFSLFFFAFLLFLILIFVCLFVGLVAQTDDVDEIEFMGIYTAIKVNDVDEQQLA